jgi:hypothetical protein
VIRGAVRVTDAGGLSTTTPLPVVHVRPAPPPGPLGITVNHGARFTRSRDVVISPVWPAYADQLLLANDGGFVPSGTATLGLEIPWRLEGGAGVVPSMIYARFGGGPNSTGQTYQDDIVPDEAAPTLTSARLVASPAAPMTRSQRAHRARRPRVVLAVRAEDAISGLQGLQVAVNPGRPAPWRPYALALRLGGSRPAWLRVRDVAGNVSAWARVAQPRPARARPLRRR